MRTGRRDRLAGEALITDPDVAVVVVAALLGPLRQAGGRRGDHPAAGRGQPAHDRVRVAGVARRDRPAELRHRLPPCRLGRGPLASGSAGVASNSVSDRSRTRSCCCPGARTRSHRTPPPAASALRSTAAAAVRSGRGTPRGRHRAASSAAPARIRPPPRGPPRPAPRPDRRRSAATAPAVPSSGNARASRHSITPASVIHRDRQISVPPRSVRPDTLRPAGVTMYVPRPPISDDDTASEPYRGAQPRHIAPGADPRPARRQRAARTPQHVQALVLGSPSRHSGGPPAHTPGRPGARHGRLAGGAHPVASVEDQGRAGYS